MNTNPNTENNSQTNIDNSNHSSGKKKMTSKQVVAIIGIVLLVLMYIVTLIVAIVDTSASGRMFGICLLSTFAIPLLIWIYTWMYGKMTGKSTMADLNIGGEDHVTDEEVREILIAQATTDTETEEN